MLSHRLSWAIVVLAAAVAPACSFDPHGAAVIDAAEIDAATIDALDATPIDAVDAVVVDAIDAMVPIDACVPDPLGERCNGVDDDCDLMIDELFPTLGDPCDGADTDLCLDDTVACDPSGATTVCANAAPDNDVERCNGIDDDCDGMMDEDFPTLGMSCDGPDGDLCLEGGQVCTSDGAGVVCDDLTPTTSETCNGVDDDCDGSMDEDFPTLGMPCDGADGDACTEGVFACDVSTGLPRCSDVTGTIVETCNLADDDCNGSIDETFDLTSDPTNCGVCGRTCTNPFGTTTCAASTCMPTCTTTSALDCDGDPINGCELRNTNPTCAGATMLGTVRGDAGADTLTTSGYQEAFFQVQVTETVSGGGGDIDAQFTLVSPPNTNFDLFVTCLSCGGPTLSSTLTTATDTVNIGRLDVNLVNSYRVLVEVRWFGSSACGDWALTVTGNVDTLDFTCGT